MAVVEEYEVTPQQTELSDAIYCMAMRLIDADCKAELVDRITVSACRIVGIDYPPQRMEKE